ncbi:hypothetical protein KEM48_001697 [Puccinia striiformis f. sp. tritici PST-130]|nr:hypothetical protein KEM48_001697 [Puccinia striiformis f. sp. tritici PST-130]
MIDCEFTLIGRSSGMDLTKTGQSIGLAGRQFCQSDCQMSKMSLHGLIRDPVGDRWQTPPRFANLSTEHSSSLTFTNKDVDVRRANHLSRTTESLQAKQSSLDNTGLQLLDLTIRGVTRKLARQRNRGPWEHFRQSISPFQEKIDLREKNPNERMLIIELAWNRTQFNISQIKRTQESSDQPKEDRMKQYSSNQPTDAFIQESSADQPKEKTSKEDLVDQPQEETTKRDSDDQPERAASKDDSAN